MNWNILPVNMSLMKDKGLTIFWKKQTDNGFEDIIQYMRTDAQIINVHAEPLV